jgi:ketosteroid isomerase-like protein
MNVNEIIFNLEMMNHHKNIVRESIQNFAAALNSGNVENVLSFFSEEAVFMPDGFKTLKKKQIGNSGSNYLKEIDFKIQFDNVKIDVKDNYAFVEAVGNTSQIIEKNLSTIEKQSRDFFVLKQEKNLWKISNYIFNNVTVSKD